MWTKEDQKLYDKKRYMELTPSQKKARLEASRRSYIKNHDKVLKRCRERHLQINYNISSEQYLEMVLKQQNCCAVCRKPEHRICKTGDIKPLSVDHNHITNEVRELLCNDCNSLLGFAKENIDVLQNAIKYLRKHSE